MPPQSLPPKFQNFTFFHCHRKPAQNRPTVRGSPTAFLTRILNTPPPPLNPNPSISTSGTHTCPIPCPPLLRPTPTTRPSSRSSPPSPASYSMLSARTGTTGALQSSRSSGSSAGSHPTSLPRCSRSRTTPFQPPSSSPGQGKPPSEKQFEILIRMHCDANRGLRVYYVYEKMKKLGVKPRVFLYNRIMDALAKTGYLDLALSVYKDFRGDGLVEESVTFMILIKGMCKMGRIDETLQLLERMRANLCKPDVFAYTAMIKVLLLEGNLDGCLRVWEEMKRERVEADAMAYATLVTGLYKKVGVACDLLKDLVDSGYRADLGIYNSLIEGLCNVKRVDKAYKIFRVTVQEGLQPEFATVNPILVFYVETRRMDKLCEMLAQMEKFGFPVIDDLSKFFSFMVGKEDGVTMALEVFEKLKVKGYYCFVL
ncbi:hypothetical protein ACFX2I_028442 [Malus domestica]